MAQSPLVSRDAKRNVMACIGDDNMISFWDLSTEERINGVDTNLASSRASDGVFCAIFACDSKNEAA